MTATLSPSLADTVTRRFATRTRLAFAVPAAILAYLIYAAISFDLAGLAQRARFDNAAILLGDFWSHKTHVIRDNRTDKVTVAIEGENKGTYPDGMLPDWVSRRGWPPLASMAYTCALPERDSVATTCRPSGDQDGALLDPRKLASSRRLPVATSCE